MYKYFIPVIGIFELISYMRKKELANRSGLYIGMLFIALTLEILYGFASTMLFIKLLTGK
jgi:uncharacterized membrane protein